MNELTIGEKAPDFKLVGTDLEPIQLSDYKGKKLVVLFIPLAFTSVCTAEMCTARDDMDLYKGLEAEILGVSVDSPFVLKKFGEDNQLNFKLGSDFDRKMSTDYNALFQGDFMGLSRFSTRTSVVIDQEGIVRYAKVAESGQIPNFDEIKEALEKV